ncbi:MAG: FAD-dependent oxidoreductase, partial [Clostridia bacterium]|nr:FAD-dependent oxidoreductase [Clostridia bacterium]
MSEKVSKLQLLAVVMMLGLAAFALGHEKNKKEVSIDFENVSEFNVIVVGADPEGIAAAVSSARNGMSTLLVDHRNR